MAATSAPLMRLQAVQGSRSAPSLSKHGFQAPTKFLPNRGAHDVGAVEGLERADGIYVPRAMWTESADSVLRHRHQFDARQFLADEDRRQRQEGTLRTYLRRGVDHQLEGGGVKALLRETQRQESQDVARAADADMARLIREQAVVREELQKTRQLFRAGLDKQAADHARKFEEQKLEMAREAAEMKLRMVQELCKDITEQAQRKQVARKEAAALLTSKEAKDDVVRREKRREAEELRRRLQMQTVEEERRFVVQQGRIKAAQDHQEAIDRFWAKSIGKEDAERQLREEQRQDRDEKRHTRLTDLFYAKREAARERQRLKMVEGLREQVGAAASRKRLEDMEKQAELEVVLAASRKTIEQELHKQQFQKAQELELQHALVQQMAEKQQRAREQGQRLVPSLATMVVTPALLASTAARSPNGFSSSGSCPAPSDVSQRLDAPKYLSKPMGSIEAKPWVDITRSHGVGGVVGVFSGEGKFRAPLCATGGPGRLLTKTVQRANQDRERRRLAASWSEGMAPEELKAGRKAAAKRAAANAADKSDA